MLPCLNGKSAISCNGAKHAVFTAITSSQNPGGLLNMCLCCSISTSQNWVCRNLSRFMNDSNSMPIQTIWIGNLASWPFRATKDLNFWKTENIFENWKLWNWKYFWKLKISQILMKLWSIEDCVPFRTNFTNLWYRIFKLTSLY
jgi:hypothetical protein